MDLSVLLGVAAFLFLMTGAATQTCDSTIDVNQVAGLIESSSPESTLPTAKKNLTKCYSCENCAVVTKNHLTECSVGQNMCLTSISNGIVNRGCGNSEYDGSCQQNGEIFLCACSEDGCNGDRYHDPQYSQIKSANWNLKCYSCVDCEYVDYELTKNVSCSPKATACIKMTSNGITTRGCSCGTTNDIGYRCVIKLGITTCTCGTSFCNGSGRAYSSTAALLATAIMSYLIDALRTGE